jgi:hypothetical protein
MSSKGMMRRARRLATLLALFVPVAFAQTPPAPDGDDLDVTMRVIVDPNAKVPDEIVRKIPLPKPATPATSSDKKNDNAESKDGGKPSDPGSKGKGNAPDARGQGREFGQQVSEDAKKRSEDARHGKPPDKPPRGPPDRPDPNPRKPD